MTRIQVGHLQNPLEQDIHKFAGSNSTSSAEDSDDDTSDSDEAMSMNGNTSDEETTVEKLNGSGARLVYLPSVHQYLTLIM